MPQNIPAAALYNACAARDVAAVSRLLHARGTRLNLSGPPFQDPTTKSTPLMVAAFSGHICIARMLLARAPNTLVDYANAMGFTALLAAAQYHHADILRLLADRGANVCLHVGQQGCTPLRLAVGETHPDEPPRGPDPGGERQLATVRVLLRLGAGTLTSPPHRPLRPPHRCPPRNFL